MNEYNFETLNDKEFEALSVDLLSHELGVRIERFKPGKDSGIDGRYFVDKNEAYVQCKHWLKSGFNKLVNHIKKKEIQKVEKLNPEKYIFVTSLPLSRANKKTIYKSFNPFIASENDIYGKEDLNDLIRKFPDVERNHYKLWLTSSAILRNMLNAAIIGRSKFKIEEILEASRKYVITDNHIKAINKLEENNSVIIVGAPGIGKTTLAEQISLEYIAKGYDLMLLDDSINEAESVFDESKKQIFYYDDFLGRNYLRAIENKQDSKIVNFINRVKKDKKKRFVLTSRANIINRGKFLSDLFGIKKLEQNEYLLKIQSLSRLDKAKILYNHIYFSSLDSEFIDELYENDRYIKIIDHENYNPRIIEFITDSYRVQDVSVNKYWVKIKNTLSNPKEIWAHTFEHHIDTECRLCVIGIVLHRKPISENYLTQFIGRLRKFNLSNENSRSVLSTIKLLVGSLLNKNFKYRDRAEYDLFNPSIGDFVLSSLLDDCNLIADVMYCLRTTNSLTNLNSIVLDKKISVKFYLCCIQKIYTTFSANEVSDFNNEYVLQLNIIILRKSIQIEGFKKNLANGLDGLFKSENTVLHQKQLELILLSLRKEILKKDSVWLKDVLANSLDNERYFGEELELISSICKSVIISEKTEIQIKKQVTDHIYEVLHDEVRSSGIYDGIFEIDEIDKDELGGIVDELASNFNIEYTDQEVEEIVDDYDFDEIIQYNIEISIPDEDDERFWPGRGSSADSSPSGTSESADSDIRNLFER